MQIAKHISLRHHNTFGIDVNAAYYTELHQLDDLAELSEKVSGYEGHLVIGGGSNILFTQPVNGLVIKNCLKGIETVEENNAHVWLQVMAGEVWHEFVLHAINNNLGGIENLSLIPGCVGASPMQNIGAYGVEVKDTIDEVVAWDWEKKSFTVFKNKDCRFGYRGSIFKQELKNKVLITSVTFRLDKTHRLNTSYGAIRQELDVMGVSEPTIKSVSEAVIAIRSSKLPDPKKIGNAGSFFKNPAITIEQFDQLKEHYMNIPSYPADDNLVKVPAGWLIEQSGWKGYRNGDAGVHEKQALVLVNYGNATGNEIWKLSEDIIASVKTKFNITLEREVQIW